MVAIGEIPLSKQVMGAISLEQPKILSLRQTQKVGKSGIKSCRIQYIIMSKM